MVKENGMAKIKNIMKESLFKAKKKDLESITLINLKSIKESLKIIFLMEKEYYMIKIKSIKACGLKEKIFSYFKLKVFKIDENNRIILMHR